jgi:hypothetical protein
VNKLDYILGVLDGGAQIVAATGGAAGPIGASAAAAAVIADYFLKIAQAAVRAHEGVTGKPLDMATLHQIDPVP